MGCADVSPRESSGYILERARADAHLSHGEPKSSFGVTKEDEQARRNWLKDKKPYVWGKIQKYPEMVEAGKSIAIIQFQYDYTCNFKCEHCSIDKFQMTPSVEQASGRKYYGPHDGLESVKDLSRQADEYGLAQFVITGGEPLIIREYDDLVKAIDPERHYIVSDSNGWHLDEERAQHLVDIGVDKMQISLDGLDPKQHDGFRNMPGSHERVMRAIDACKSVGMHMILSTVLWHDRAGSQEFIDYLEFAKAKGIGTYVSFAKPVGSYEGRMDQLVTDEDEAWLTALEDKYDVFTHLTPSYGFDFGCIAVKRILPVTRYGDVLSCPYQHFSMGNLFEEKLESIIGRAMKHERFSYKNRDGTPNKQKCLCGNDMDFINKYIVKTYGAEVPVSHLDILEPGEYIGEVDLENASAGGFRLKTAGSDGGGCGGGGCGSGRSAAAKDYLAGNNGGNGNGKEMVQLGISKKD